jgi:hypothetical protein
MAIDAERAKFQEEMRKSQQKAAASLREAQALTAASKNKRTVLKKDITAGREFGKEVLGPEGLGRLGTDEKVQETLSRFEDLSKGIGAEEMAGRKSEALQGIDQQSQTQARSLQAALARSGVKGGAAAGQQRELALGSIRAKAGVERDLLTDDFERRRGGLKDFANAAGQVKQFDLSQAAAEKNIELSSGLGFAQIAAAERGAKLAADAQRASAAASSGGCFSPLTMVVMKDGTTRMIGNLKIGDMTSKGKIIGLSEHLVKTSSLVDYDGVVVTTGHPVLEEEWRECGTSDIALSILVPEEDIIVYDLFTEEFRIEVVGRNKVHTFTDYEGVDIREINQQIIKGLNEAL